MAQIREIKRRLKNTTSIHQITKAMKMVATARLKRAQQRIINARPYAYRIAEVIRRLAAHMSGGTHPLLRVRPEGRTLLLIITADRGLCGSFNTNVLRQAQVFLRKNPKAILLTVGKKGRDFLRRRKYEVRREWNQVFPDVSPEVISEIRDEIEAIYVTEEIQSITALYTEFKTVVQQKVTLETLLPLKLNEVVRPESAENHPAAGDYLFEPDEDTILNALLSQYLAAQVRRMLLESFASEMGAKRNAMESATKNASQMINKLTLEFNRARQGIITKELAEIVGGAEALR
jgi:F-type H+-transporting ATPase subunit gamma